MPMRSALTALALASVLLAPPLGTAGERAAGPPVFEHVHSLAFDASGNALWLAAHTGLYRSEDTGRTWTKIALPVQGHEPDVMTIAVHPTDAFVLHVGTHEAGVLKTTDGGKTWQAVNRGLGGLDIHGLAIDPNVPDKIHAVVREKGSGIYRTVTGARGGWVRVDDGPVGETRFLASVNISTGMGGIFLYAGTGEGLQRNLDCF